MILQRWLRVRDREREQYPWLPRRDRNLIALREVVWHCAWAGNALNRIIDREVRKP